MGKKLKKVLRLTLPLAGVGYGFIAPTWQISVIVWCLSLAVSTLNTRLEFKKCDNSDTIPVFLLTITNIWILGLVLIPFACVYFVYQALDLGIKHSGISGWLQKNGLKDFFILLFLNLSVWGLIFTRVLIENLWLAGAVYAVCMLVFGLSLRKSIGLAQHHQNRTFYLVANAFMFLFSVCAAVTAFIWPNLVSTDWCGLLLILWLSATLTIMLILSILLWLVATIVSWFKK